MMKNEDQYIIAQGIMRFLDDCELKTEGQWKSWIDIFDRLPPRFREDVWNMAMNKLPENLVPYLEEWRMHGRFGQTIEAFSW